MFGNTVNKRKKSIYIFLGCMLFVCCLIARCAYPIYCESKERTRLDAALNRVLPEICMLERTPIYGNATDDVLKLDKAVCLSIADATGDGDVELLASVSFADHTGHLANCKNYVFDLQSGQLQFVFYGELPKGDEIADLQTAQEGVFRCRTPNGDFVLLCMEHILAGFGANQITTEIHFEKNTAIAQPKRLYGVFYRQSTGTSVGVEFDPLSKENDSLAAMLRGYAELDTETAENVLAVSDWADAAETEQKAYLDYLSSLRCLDSRRIIIGYVTPANSEYADSITENVFRINEEYILKFTDSYGGTLGK